MCIEASKKCDGIYDCPERDDESSSVCPTMTCPSFAPYKCTKSNKCGIRCDGRADCTHAEDEIGCPNTNHDCSDLRNLFYCTRQDKSTYCIPNAWACDGIHDCEPHGEDESMSSCPPGHKHPCASGVYCNGQCLDIQKVCDGTKDCPNNEDEEGCEYSCKEKSEFYCTNDRSEANRKSPVCISQEKVCDGTEDCPSGKLTS